MSIEQVPTPPVVRWQHQVVELARQAGRLAAVTESGRSGWEVGEVAEDAAEVARAIAAWATDLAWRAGEAEQTAMELECGRVSAVDGCGWLAMELDRLAQHLQGSAVGAGR